MEALGGQVLLRRPVAALVEVIRHWREGDYAARAGLRGSSEIAALGRAFDGMADALEGQIRQREQVEHDLRRANELLDLVTEHLPVGVVLIGDDSTILRLNAASERIWAASRKVGIDRYGADRYGDYKGWRTDTGKRIEPHEWTWTRAITKGETVLGEVIDIEAFDGTRKTIRNSAVPLRNGSGQIIGAVVVNEDITERRTAQ